MVRRGTAVALVALLVLAGCNGAPGGTTTPDLTAAPVPDAPATGTPAGQLAPGLTENGVTAPGRLTAAHAAILANQSFAIEQTTVQRRAGGTLLARYETRAAFSADKRRFRYVLVQRNREGDELVDRRVRQFADGDRVLESVTDANGTRYAVVRNDDGTPKPPRAFFPTNLSNRLALARVFSLFDTAVQGRRTIDGQPHYVVTVAGGSADVPPLRNVTLEALVAESGLVRSYRVTYQVDRGEMVVHVTVSVRYRQVGETEVRRPEWADTAANATG